MSVQLFSSVNIKSLLLESAQKSNMTNQYACAIVFRNEILSIGFNSYETAKCCLSKSCLL